MAADVKVVRDFTIVLRQPDIREQISLNLVSDSGTALVCQHEFPDEE